MADEDRFHAGQILTMCKEVSLYYPDAFGEVFIKEIVNGENVPSDLYMYAAQIGTAAAHAQPVSINDGTAASYEQPVSINDGRSTVHVNLVCINDGTAAAHANTEYK